MSNSKITCPECKREGVGTVRVPVYPPRGRAQILKVAWHKVDGVRCDGTGEPVSV